MRLLKKIFNRKTPAVNMKKFLIVGLGNIGEKYKKTRHNVGFQIIDRLAERNKCNWELKKLASYSSIDIKGRKLILIKPETFMNRSGKAVRYWALKENIPLENILIVTDELHLPFGTLRLKPKGSSGGHNGLKDIESQLNTLHYARIRFGIGHEKKALDQVKFVLAPWDDSEQVILVERIDFFTEAIISFGLEGIENAMNRFNGK